MKLYLSFVFIQPFQSRSFGSSNSRHTPPCLGHFSRSETVLIILETPFCFRINGQYVLQCHAAQTPSNSQYNHDGTMRRRGKRLASPPSPTTLMTMSTPSLHLCITNTRPGTGMFDICYSTSTICCSCCTMIIYQFVILDFFPPSIR